jgi:beta-1,2-mannobiose phosphorylase / 1,2-beta-oligomannan phosphorylase
MIDVKNEGIVLSKRDFGFEAEGVLNPAVIKDENGIHIFYRAVAKGNYSTIGYCKFSDPFTIESRLDYPLLVPQNDFDSNGIEDPRIVKIDNLYYLTYTGYDGVNALGALSVSKDLINFERYGIIVPQITFDHFGHLASSKSEMAKKYFRYNIHGGSYEKNGKQMLVWDKNVIFFPRRINGKLYFLHRIRPDIQLVCINELKDLTFDFWQKYLICFEEHILLAAKHKFEISYIGGGCPPIETEFGWLLIYHAVHDTLNGYVYSACAALLDLENPLIEISRLPYPLFKPQNEWELNGVVNNVCFPTGAIVVDDKLYVYYGAADEQIALVSMSLSHLLKELISNK